MNLTFLIPIKLESDDRIRNLITVLTYLLTRFDAKIIVKECDFDKKFNNYILSHIKNKFGDLSNKLIYEFEEQKTAYFHKTKILNDILMMSNTEVVCNYDTDVLLPESSYIDAYNLIKKGIYDAVYPYGCGIYQRAVQYTPDVFNEFISSDLNVSRLDKYSTINNSTIGWCQFVRRENYINSFMMNENFYAWGPEDCEFYYRLNVLGNRVGRVDNYVYHLEHSRSTDSWFSNPKWRENTILWNWIRTRSKEEILQYYNNQNYYKQRIEQ